MGGLFKPTTKVTYTSAPSATGAGGAGGTSAAAGGAGGTSAAAGITQATAGQEQEGARLRGVRRRGRQLLSDARLSPEAGLQTLGSDQTLGA